jgi:hypothetical protein
MPRPAIDPERERLRSAANEAAKKYGAAKAKYAALDKALKFFSHAGREAPPELVRQFDEALKSMSDAFLADADARAACEAQR